MKDSYWFPHDSNARNDEKIIDLIMDLGYEGYGLYWAIIEVLRDSTNYEAEYKVKRLAHQLQSPEDVLQQIIEGYGLFVINDGRFYASSLKKRMSRWDAKKEQARNAANVRHGKNKSQMEQGEEIEEVEGMQGQCVSNAPAEQEQCKNNKDNKNRKEEKRRDSKEKGKAENDIDLFTIKNSPSFYKDCLDINPVNPIIFIQEYFYFLHLNEGKPFDSVIHIENSFKKWFQKYKHKNDLGQFNKYNEKVFSFAKFGFNLDIKDYNDLFKEFYNMCNPEGYNLSEQVIEGFINFLIDEKKREPTGVFKYLAKKIETNP